MREREAALIAVPSACSSKGNRVIVDSPNPASREAVVTMAADELPASLTRRMLDACPTPMILFENRASDCVVRYVNPAFAHRTGYSAAELAQIGWDCIHMDGRDLTLARVHAAIQQQRALDLPVRIHG